MNFFYQLKTISLEIGNKSYSRIHQQLNEENLNTEKFGILPGNYPISIIEKKVK